MPTQEEIFELEERIVSECNKRKAEGVTIVRGCFGSRTAGKCCAIGAFIIDRGLRTSKGFDDKPVAYTSGDMCFDIGQRVAARVL